MQTTPVKVDDKKDNEKTPEKLCESENVKSDKINNHLTPVKNLNVPKSPELDKNNGECEKKTPPKTDSVEHNRENELTPAKNQNTLEFKSPDGGKSDHKTPQKNETDGESDGLISTTEQARLLIAASKTPVKSMNKTPIKQNTPTGKRCMEQSPRTPGKYRRVELITLASPKAKKLKEM